MKLLTRRERPRVAIQLPQNLPVDLPEELSVTVPEAVAEGLSTAVSDVSAAAASLPESLSSVEVTGDLPFRIAERLRAWLQGIRLPRLVWRYQRSGLEAALLQRERELEALRSRSDRSLAVGLAVGTVAGAAAVFALLPNREARIAEIRERLGGIDAPGEYVEDARRLAVRARESVAERVHRAREEARQAREQTTRDLWSKYEVAKRDGRVPPSQ